MRILFFVITLNFFSAGVFAVRPFITDDARVVGYRLAQYEGWTRFDRFGGEFWSMVAYGPNRFLELSLGGVTGYELHQNKRPDFTAAAPLVQAKFLFNEYSDGKPPGFGLVAGTFLPYGFGELRPSGYGSFAFATISQCIGKNENVLIHANVGANFVDFKDNNSLVYTWGYGTQIKAYKGFHLVAEHFSGDPYVPGTGMAIQVGFRHFFSDNFQIDGTYGKGISGEFVLPHWFSFGVRIVTEKFYKK
ncbi:MAG: transporter [Bacteroidia bacterium]